MDKCIKVLVPTGEVRLKFDPVGYLPGDGKSRVVLDGIVEGSFSILPHSEFKDWVSYVDKEKQLTFPVIAQYGDEFPV